MSFFVYSFFGWCTEVIFSAIRLRSFVNRGFLNGPICPIYGFGIVTVILILYEYQYNAIKLYCTSVVIATLLEWITGLLLEKLFHHRWWDYSNQPFNIQGHICLVFSLAWGVACVIVINYFHPVIIKFIQCIPNRFNTIVIAELMCIFIADIYITVYEIFELNIRLKKMQMIADEMERLSANIGENLSKGVITTINKKNEAKQKIEEKYMVQIENLSYTNKRLLRAFPKMQSLKYKKQLQTLKEYINKKKGDN